MVPERQVAHRTAWWEAPALSGSLAEQLAAPEPALEFVVDELAFRGANVAILAQAKAGKTRLNLNVAHSLMSGDPLFGHYPVQAVPSDRSVAWWNAELSVAQAQQWLRQMDFPRADDFHPLHLRGYPTPFEVQAVEDWAVAWLTERHVTVWMIDPLSALFGGDENSNTEMGAWLSALDRIKRRAGVETLFLVHHVAESSVDIDTDNPNAGRLLKSRGASRLMGWADILWSYTGRFDEPRYIAALGRDVDVAPFGGLHMHPDTGMLRWSGQMSSPVQDRQRARAVEAWDLVAAWDPSEPITATKLQNAMKGAKPDAKRRGIELAVREGWINLSDGPGNSVLHSLGDRSPRGVVRLVSPASSVSSEGSANQ
jgi:AAA domain